MPVDPLIYVTCVRSLDQSFVDALNADLFEQIGRDRFSGPKYCALTLVSKHDKALLPDGLPDCDTVLEAHLLTPYYGPGYERGTWPEIAAVLEFLRRRIPDAQVWYGADAGDQVEEIVDESMRKMWNYWATHGGRPYYSR
jgi:hypothetical protein